MPAPSPVDTLTLSGTATVTVNGVSFGGGTNEYILLWLYDYDPDGSDYYYGNLIGNGSVSSGNWSMIIEKPASPATYYINLNIRDGSGNEYSNQKVKSVSVSNTDVSGITVIHNFTVLSGTVTLAANGSPLPAGISVSVSLASSPDGSGQVIGYTNVYTGTAWSMALNETPLSGTYYFRVSTWNSGGEVTNWSPNVGQISFPTASYSGITITHNFSQ
jgi:hypothetical protein